jgi:pimeloyl-ACP methyl ester carboxylesterase
VPQIKGVIFAACFAAPPRPVLLELARLLPLAAIMRIRPPTWLTKHYCLGQDAKPSTIQLLRDALSAVQPGVLAGRLMELADIRSILGEIALPCCYIQATEDRLVPENAVDAFKTIAPDIEIRRVDGPHFILQARPGECAEIIGEFLRRRMRAHAVSTD